MNGPLGAPAGITIVLGIGNVLLGDDGVGVEVVLTMGRLRAAGAIELPAGTRLIDGGTLGLDLLPLLSGAGAVVFVDAAEIGGAPGAVEVLDGDRIAGSLLGGCIDDRAGLHELVAAARIAGMLPASVSIVGIQPAGMEPGVGVSAAVRSAIPAAVHATLRQLRGTARIDAPRPVEVLSRGRDMAGAAA